MIKNNRDITGLRVGYLVGVKPIGKNKKGQTMWLTKCDCGNEATIMIYNLLNDKRPTQSCGCLRREVVSKRMSGENHYKWSGGEGCINGQGYVKFRHGELRGLLKHRYVYEQHYGITLTPNQNIHHINGDRLDNRIENLELWDTSQPSGQRIEDKIKFYFELVENYKDHPLYKDLIKKGAGGF